VPVFVVSQLSVHVLVAGSSAIVTTRYTFRTSVLRPTYLAQASSRLYAHHLTTFTVAMVPSLLADTERWFADLVLPFYVLAEKNGAFGVTFDMENGAFNTVVQRPFGWYVDVRGLLTRRATAYSVPVIVLW